MLTTAGAACLTKGAKLSEICAWLVGTCVCAAAFRGKNRQSDVKKMRNMGVSVIDHAFDMRGARARRKCEDRLSLCYMDLSHLQSEPCRRVIPQNKKAPAVSEGPSKSQNVSVAYSSASACAATRALSAAPFASTSRSTSSMIAIGAMSP